MTDNLQDKFPKNKQRFKYLLFDLDNTLLDYDLAESTALTSLFRDFHCKEDLAILLPIYHKINSGYWRAFEDKKIKLKELKVSRFHDLIEAFPSLHHLDAEICSEVYLDHLSEQIHPIAGAFDLLETLQDQYEMCLVTNGIARVQHRRISKSGLDRFFREVIISEEIGFSKPDAAFFSYTLKKLGDPAPNNVLIIGDNLNSDVLGGMRNGLAGCWYNPGNIENSHDVSPTFMISKLSELINLLT